ncbi:MAG: hypothetical protein LLG40_15725 [Deltaproteobacteria bacterium]|nr:hypothetical protein [Deltaproteobacteria bacterium]
MNYPYFPVGYFPPEAAGAGTPDYPDAANVLTTDTVNGVAGTCVLPTAAQVQTGVAFGPAAALVGTYGTLVIALSALTRQDYITAVSKLVGGELPLGEAEIIMAITKAVRRYSIDKPLIVAEDETGNGSFDYALTLLSYFTDGFSSIKKVEYPVDDADETADVLQDDAWMIYHKPAGNYLRFLEDQPASTETIRITYTALHICNDTQCTIPASDEDAVQMLAAAGFCDMLATYYAQTSDSTIMADSVDHKSKAAEYAARARAYRKEYFDHMGIKDGQTVGAASVTRDQDAKTSHGLDHVTHPRKWR